MDPLSDQCCTTVPYKLPISNIPHGGLMNMQAELTIAKRLKGLPLNRNPPGICGAVESSGNKMQGGIKLAFVCCFLSDWLV